MLHIKRSENVTSGHLCFGIQAEHFMVDREWASLGLSGCFNCKQVFLYFYLLSLLELLQPVHHHYLMV